MPVKKATRSKASAASKKSPSAATASSKTAARSKRQFGPGAMLVTAMCVTGAVIVIAAHEMTPNTRAASTSAPAASEVVTVSPKPVASTGVTDPAVVTPVNTDTEADKTSTTSTAPVTIFGCLERSKDTYRLTDTDGVDAPKSRSWKTGFLKKGSASVEVVDPANRARLSTHVGHRIGVTGTMSQKQLQVRSVRKISSSCGN